MSAADARTDIFVTRDDAGRSLPLPLRSPRAHGSASVAIGNFRAQTGKLVFRVQTGKVTGPVSALDSLLTRVSAGSASNEVLLHAVGTSRSRR
jgi:hypothetical protein